MKDQPIPPIIIVHLAKPLLAAGGTVIFVIAPAGIVAVRARPVVETTGEEISEKARAA